ncbi:hypothetical protein BGAL_0145g00230 [Botrytis galanthina]|uniref:Uncharacterized protein n=1 Tax=Botrytis galanthina TaxID=278940 RepID=A0A4V4HUS9_9HELO|nr:hypothetical protein BGAL_0145g00230 [Botrytis galanthina]
MLSAKYIQAYLQILDSAFWYQVRIEMQGVVATHIEEALIVEDATSTATGVVVGSSSGQRNPSSVFKTSAFDAWKCGVWERRESEGSYNLENH